MSNRFSFLASLIRNSHHILLFTGAGISTKSGIPDFRGPTGIWTKRKPVYYREFMTNEASRIEHWDYKLEGREALANARPNSVHYSIVKLEENEKVLMVITQNIDGLHSLAGTNNNHLIELHGTDRLVECQTCKWRGEAKLSFDYFRSYRKTPTCNCGGYLKTATISFGQELDLSLYERAETSAILTDLVISLGTTLSVNPAANIPLIAAKRGVPYIIINQGATAHDDLGYVTLRIDDDVGNIFPAAVDAALAEP